MAYFVEHYLSNVPRNIAVVDTVLLPPVDCRGHDAVLIVVTNNSATETFNGRASSSPDGTNQWADADDDQFQSIGPGVSRRMTLYSRDHLWVRVIGSFVGAPDTVSLSVVRLRGATRRA